MLWGGGCVSRAEYDEARRLNRIAIKQRDEYKLDAERLQGELRDANSLLAEHETTVRNQRALIEQYKQDYDELSDALRRAREEYERQLQGRLPEPLINVRVLPAPLDKALRDFATENPDLVEYHQARGMVKLKADLTFRPGSDFVQPPATAALTKFVQIVNSPSAEKFHVYIAGHTDDMPIAREPTRRRHPNNWYLSVHRAVAVQQVLQKAGLSAQRIGVMGFSEYHPVAANKPNKGGNEKNRRVEIWIVPPSQFLTATGAKPPEGK
jgi:chemotaxis protein MotB